MKKPSRKIQSVYRNQNTLVRAVFERAGDARKIPKDQIFLGGEDEAAYVANFTEALRAKGYLVVRVNAYEASENRENLLASTDTLDLLGIAKTLLSRRARTTGNTSSVNAIYQQGRRYEKRHTGSSQEKGPAPHGWLSLSSCFFHYRG